MLARWRPAATTSTCASTPVRFLPAAWRPRRRRTRESCGRRVGGARVAIVQFRRGGRASFVTRVGSWPAWMVQAILPETFAVIAYRYVADLPRHFRHGSRGQPRDAP